MVGVVAADAVLKLQGIRDGVVELPPSGVPVADGVHRVRVRCENVFERLYLGVERVGDLTQAAGVQGVIRHEGCSGRSG